MTNQEKELQDTGSEIDIYVQTAFGGVYTIVGEKLAEDTSEFTNKTPSFDYSLHLDFEALQSNYAESTPSGGRLGMLTQRLKDLGIVKRWAAEPIETTFESRLMRNFEDLVDNLDVADLAVVSHNRSEIRDLDKFRFAPIESSYSNYNSRSIESAGFFVKLPQGVHCNYDVKGKPYLDTRKALGLVYDDHLIAVGAAGVSLTGNTLLIKQLQDVTGVHKNMSTKKEYYSTGLHNGMDWRQTLVRGWEQVATELGMPSVTIQGYMNSRWEPVRERGYPSYDGVAAQMGYEPDGYNNWVKELK